MVICDDKKCIFIHIPKTGGTSIEQYISDHGRHYLRYLGIMNNRSAHHFTAIELRKQVYQIFNYYYKFSIVRNPYDRLLSEYYWTPIQGIGYKAGKDRSYFLYHVQNIVHNKKYFETIYHDHFIPQYMFIYEGKKLLVDQLFKYEDLEWVSQYLKRKLDIKRDFPLLNKTNIQKVEWTEVQKNKIYNLYKKDFELFGYKK